MTGPGALHWIRPDDPPDAFPDPQRALHEPDGLLAVGGDLSPERLLAAYRRGIFPWYEAGQPILWWSPDPRAVLLPDELKVSTSLRKALRSRDVEVTLDRAFADVISGCAAPRPRQRGTWLTPDMQRAYARLHELGYAHSVEVWEDGTLAGGLYGVALGRVFFGESMFSRLRDASKVALVHLVAETRAWLGADRLSGAVPASREPGQPRHSSCDFPGLIAGLCGEGRPDHGARRPATSRRGGIAPRRSDHRDRAAADGASSIASLPLFMQISADFGSLGGHRNPHAEGRRDSIEGKVIETLPIPASVCSSRTATRSPRASQARCASTTSESCAATQ
jgi:leucyl/phenylalanyl-tRNA--protein transferase